MCPGRCFCSDAAASRSATCATEGLEFETADRYADQVAAAGGLDAWIAQLDADPQRWVERLELRADRGGGGDCRMQSSSKL